MNNFVSIDRRGNREPGVLKCKDDPAYRALVVRQTGNRFIVSRTRRLGDGVKTLNQLGDFDQREDAIRFALEVSHGIIYRGGGALDVWETAQ